MYYFLKNLPGAYRIYLIYLLTFKHIYLGLTVVKKLMLKVFTLLTSDNNDLANISKTLLIYDLF